MNNNLKKLIFVGEKTYIYTYMHKNINAHLSYYSACIHVCSYAFVCVFDVQIIVGKRAAPYGCVFPFRARYDLAVDSPLEALCLLPAVSGSRNTSNAASYASMRVLSCMHAF